MKNIYISLFILSATLIFINCSKQSDTEQIRKSIFKANPALESMLEMYKGDSLKYKAALFLIDNLGYYNSPKHEDMEFTYTAYKIFSAGKYTYQQALDSATTIHKRSRYSQNTTWISDVDISSGYLVSNIEWAFKVWREQPWGKKVSFEQFCEYILPYRVGNEELIPWREKLYYQFMPIIEKHINDSNIVNPTYAAHIILDSLLKEPFYFTGEMSPDIRIGPQIVDWRGGSCLDLCDMLVYIYRALGIPCGIEELPLRGNNNVPHYWNFIEDENGQTWYFSMFYWWHRLLKSEVYDDVYGKVFRHRFSLNREMMDTLRYAVEKLHPTFQYPFFDDVTHLYATNKSLTININKKDFRFSPQKNEPIYLCMSSRLDWKPVGISFFDGDNVEFTNCHGGVIYCLACYDSENNKLIPITSPFNTNKENDTIHFYQPEKENEDVVLFSKFGMLGEFFIDRMVNGVFEGSNSANFRQKDTLYHIKKSPHRLCTIVNSISHNKYRYVRYWGPTNGYGNIAEAAFFKTKDDSSALKGKIIGAKEGKNGTHSYYNVFDDNTETSYDHPHEYGGWAGLDLGTKQSIEKICYTPRNRDNFVRPGDIYELFICKYGVWYPMGKQTATSDSLLYENIPKNTLLLLKNYSRGNAERLFEYKNKKQFFW